ncbi:hypothetical protein [Algibacter luteus]|uniref:hypothetical protein n=1 Tax=Algibacter luteus TaxID=1178825 RepID=UPI002599B965|nr:hypothetical protein [Algibacter luteus]WJJ97554.1 hypothetical protein O5O44_04035 [Algibacter luteus]
MKTPFLSIIVASFITLSAFSQISINNYKYVIVPEKFDFLKTQDEFQLNSLTKFLFNKYGFEAVMEGSEYPADLALNRCLALDADVLNESNLFKTKLKIELKDCNDKLVHETGLGESREKEYKKAYNFALREAFKKLEPLNYNYVPNESITSITTATQSPAKKEVTQEIAELKKEIQNLKKEKQAEVTAVEKPKVETPEVKVQEPKPVKQLEVKETTVIEGVSNVLYAQEIENGFQLVDSSPKVVYRIKKTNLNDVFLVEGSSAIIYKKGNDWVIEYYTGATLEQEALNIKF